MPTKPTHTVSVRKQCGSHCVAPEDAESLFNQVSHLLKDGENVTLDFQGVETLASSFLNVAIGRLFGQFNPNFLEKHLQWSGVDRTDNQLIDLVIRNAVDHYKQDPVVQAQRDKIVKSISEAKG